MLIAALATTSKTRVLSSGCMHVDPAYGQRSVVSGRIVQSVQPAIDLILLRRECRRSVCPADWRHLANLCPETLKSLTHRTPLYTQQVPYISLSWRIISLYIATKFLV